MRPLERELGVGALGLVLVDTGPVLESARTDHVSDEVETALRSYPSRSAWRNQLSLIHQTGDSEILDWLASTSVVARVDGRFEASWPRPVELVAVLACC